ncbi:NADH:flavin oxidoreductase/NADH oxidase family protein [Marinicauda algicola]|uniref:NADH:flavin oxidoreductase/NADH oxidase family protein n=1 Tax=Marinicauda algicola TaxID=2029849 RepID=A0A4V3RYI4_9PROT|nr:NADH:flavin oxidoreductase/NADH oxidase family protein [Marinicauda algicola]TGY90419.1 NADH:flavin oxidoreductase/NADH oxidase family protein [Marinicauda algicola]
MTLSSELTLPCGARIPNRLAKAAMTEGLAEPGGIAGERIVRAYTAWAQGGAGLILTGNMMVDRRYRERPANVVVEGEQSANALKGLERFAAAAKSGGAVALAQISHAGRQSPRSVAPEPVGPSAVAVKLPGGLYAKPRALTAGEIAGIIGRFAHTARTLVEAGFDGVQIHAAHGYLISEFLNPRVNRREDEWGGSLENRARLLVETVRAVRAAIGADRVLAVKLNSSDFQKGGFSFEDCLQVVDLLDAEGIDLLEISGGSYEQPRMMGLDGLEPVLEENVRASTRAREAYFMGYAAQVIARAKTPVMVTGGFRTRAAMEAAVEEGVAVIGIGRPLCVDPDAPKKLLASEIEALDAFETRLRVGPGIFGPHSRLAVMKAVNGLATMAFFYRNIIRMAEGKPTLREMNLLGTLIAHQRQEAQDAKRI